MAVFSLSIHANYACRHAGACCTAGWRIPVDPSRQATIGAAVLVPDAHGACTHYDRASGLCRIHRDHGPAMLPISCQQFPRVSLIDDRGTFITLSHFCPTAAAALDDNAPLTILSGPAAFPDGAHYEGLDARGGWPPLLRPDAMFDLESYSRWEAWLVSTLGEAPTAGSALAVIAAAAERLREWRPNGSDFAHWLADTLSASVSSDAVARRYAAFSDHSALVAVAACGHGGPAPPIIDGAFDHRHAQESMPADCERLLCRYLASKAFASWCAYQGRGVRTLVAELYASAAVVRAHARSLAAERPINRATLLEAIRRADLLLVHGIDREAFVRWLGRVETR